MYTLTVAISTARQDQAVLLGETADVDLDYLVALEWNAHMLLLVTSGEGRAVGIFYTVDRGMTNLIRHLIALEKCTVFWC